MNDNNYCIQVFAKAPIEGYCKTRLGNDIGAKKATELHAQMINDTLSRISVVDEVSHDIQLWCMPDITHVYFHQMMSNYNIVSYQQIGDTLGDIMMHAASEALNNSYKAIIQIGTDCPGVTGSYLTHAKENFASYDIVIGPATDGGYVLLAQKMFYPNLFNNIKWGTSSVLTQLINNIEKIGLSYIQLSALTDIDTVEDLNVYNF